MMGETSTTASASTSFLPTTRIPSASGFATQRPSALYAWILATISIGCRALRPHRSLLHWGRHFEHRTFTTRLLRATSRAATAGAEEKLEENRRLAGGACADHHAGNSDWSRC